MWSFPARFLAEFFDNHGMLGVPRPPELADDARRLAPLRRGADRARFAGRLRLGTPVQAITRDDDHVLVTPARGRAERFDEVVLATHSDQALALLGDASRRASARCSARSPTSPTRRCCTPTRRLLPRRRRAVGELELPPAVGRRAAAPTVTYHMNRLQSLTAEREFCVTLTAPRRSIPRKVIRDDRLRPPGVHAAGIRRRRRLHEINGHNRTHFCGAYWGWGFHEDGVRQRAAGRGALRGAAVSTAADRAPVEASCIYERHDSPPAARRRRRDVHATGSRWLYIDLDELPRAARRPAAAPRPGLAALPPPRLPRDPSAPARRRAVRDRGRRSWPANRPTARSGC